MKKTYLKPCIDASDLEGNNLLAASLNGSQTSGEEIPEGVGSDAKSSGSIWSEE